MKTILPILFLFSLSILKAQQTHEIIWVMDISEQNASITIETGDTILWTWGENGMPHDVSSNDPNAPAGFGSSIMTGIGSSYQFTFNSEVQFNYRCSVHPNTMFGTITVVESLSRTDQSIPDLAVYPNPAKDVVSVNASIPLETYAIYTLQGKKIQEGALNGLSETLNINTLSSGMYFLELTADNHRNTVKLFKN